LRAKKPFKYRYSNGLQKYEINLIYKIYLPKFIF